MKIREQIKDGACTFSELFEAYIDWLGPIDGNAVNGLKRFVRLLSN